MKIEEILHQRAEALSQPIESQDIKTEKILVCFLGSERYGLKLDCVREVLKAEKITILPSAPEQIRGLVNLRGSILSITDPSPLLGLASEREPEQKIIIIIEVGMTQTGLLVDDVYGVVEVPLESIEPALLTLERVKGEYLRGEVQYENELIGLLNPESLLNIKKTDHRDSVNESRE